MSYPEEKPVITHAHSMVHKESSFHATVYTGSLPANKTAYCYVVSKPTAVGSDVEVHMVFGISTSQPLKVSIYEGNTVNNSGSAVNVYNRNRNSSRTGSLYIRAWVTTGSGGTGSLLYTQWIGSTTKRAEIGGDSRDTEEWILNNSSNYLIGISGSADAEITVDFDWYEED